MRKLGFVVVVTALVIAGIATTSSAQTGGDSTGVSPSAINVGYIYSAGGIAGSTFANAADGFNARVKAQNAKGGVNGRKINPVIVDDSGAQNNLQASQSLVQNDNV